MIFSLKNTRFLVQFSPHRESSAEKFDKTFVDCVSFTYFIRPYRLLLTIKISQSARENSLSYCKNFQIPCISPPYCKGQFYLYLLCVISRDASDTNISDVIAINPSGRGVI